MVIIYLVLGYWAVGKTIYANKIVFYTGNTFFMKKLCLGFILGWLLIPIAVFKMIFERKSQDNR